MYQNLDKGNMEKRKVLVHSIKLLENRLDGEDHKRRISRRGTRSEGTGYTEPYRQWL